MNGSQLQLGSPLFLSFFFGLATQQLRALVRLLIVVVPIGPLTESHPHLIHLIGMPTNIFLFPSLPISYPG